MTSTPRAPKQWKLTKDETINSFESWRQNLLYGFSQEKIFAPFLETTWQKKTATNPHRGLQDDGSSVPEAKRLTATQKNTHLELLLGQIANFCPIVSRSSIIKNSVSLNDVWQKIRLHYGFQSTGAHFLDLSNIHLSPDERPEDLYQRLMAFFEDNLLNVGGGISHQGETISTDEDLTPTLENTIVFLWLQLINPGLPQLVKQKYGSELRNKSLASLKPEISQALSSILDELRSIEDSKAMRVGNTLSPRQSPFPGTGYARPRRYVSCILCKTAGRPHTTHSLVDCRFVPQRDRRLLASARLVCDDPEECDPIDYSASEEICDLLVSPTPAQPTAPSAQRVRIVQSPVLSTFYESPPVPLTLDTGATSNMIRESSARLFGFPITPASQMARQADGVTPMDVTGEVHCTLTRGDKSFELDALVVRQLDVDILAGNPFMVRNDIAVRPAHRKIIIGGSDVVHYGMTSRHIPQPTARRTQAFLLRCPERTVVFPGEYIQLDTPIESYPDAVWALEPCLDSPSNLHLKPASAWPRPQNISSVDHAVRVPNTTNSPILLKKGEQLCQIRPIVNADSMVSCATPATSPAPSSQRARKPFSKNVTVDPGHCLPDTIRNQFHSLHLEYDDVFNPAVSKYNGASGKIEAFVNIGPTLPPQRKGRLPQYNRRTLEELQDKFDELESAGVFAKPEQVNVQVEYLNTSFLVKKPNGGSRLVTAFGKVAQYCKPQPSLMPNVDSVLRDIGKWNYLIITDPLKSFYQIPLAHSSMKFCGVATPFKGIRVYTRSAMGMPGSETCLEELMSRVLGELIQEGCVAKIADDLYVGGISFEDALQNWQRVLEALKRNNLRLSASKTIVCPRTATILGWIWSNGTLQASPHCQSLKAIPRHLQPQSSSDLPATIGVSFAADIVKRYRQLILVLRETVSSYTLTSLIESEKREHLRDGLLILSVGLRSLCDHGVTIRVDPAPGFSALHNDKDLLSHGIKLELGHAKNPNKNPVAERAVEELGLELLNISPEGGPISRVTLALATANLNSRIRRDGLSACELWTQRDQLTGEQLPIVDRQVILNQHHSRLQNHPSSSVSKAGGKPRLPYPTVSVGTLVSLVCDKSKLAAREKYLIVGLTDSNTCQLRKFTSSQFRSKVYTVPISQCFPVSPTMLAQDPQGPIRGLNEPPDSDSDDDPDPLDPTSETTLPTPPPIPDAIAPCQPDPEAPLPTAPEQPRRSTRPVRPPSWRTSDYVYD